MTSEPPRLIRDGRTKALLGLACRAVRVLGWLAAPREAPRAVAEAVAPMLETQVQRREPARVFEGVRQAALDVIPFTAAIEPAPEHPRTVADFAPSAAAVSPPPVGFGLVLAGGAEVLSHRDALGGAPTAMCATAAGTRVPGAVVAYEPATGLVLVRLAQAVGGAPRLATAAAAAGTAAVAVGHLGGVEIVAPVFIGAIRDDGYLLTGAGAAVLPGMPVGDLGGEVLAVAGAGTVPVRAYTVEPAVARLRRRLENGTGLPRTIGASLQPLDGQLAGLLGPGAAVVVEVETGTGDGLAAEDVVLAVRGRETTSLEQVTAAIAALPPDEPAPVTVRRGPRTLTVTVMPRVTLAKPDDRARASSLSEGPSAGQSFPAAALQRAGVPPDARVLAVAGGRPRTAAEAARLATRAGGPVVVRVQHRGRAFVAVLELQP